MSNLSDTAISNSKKHTYGILNEIGEAEKITLKKDTEIQPEKVQKPNVAFIEKPVSKVLKPINKNLITNLQFVQFIIVVKNTDCCISPDWEQELYQFLKSYVKRKGHCLICVDGTSDHIHLLLSMAGEYNLIEFIKDLKEVSAHFINSNYMGEALTASETVYDFLEKKKTLFDWFNGFGHHVYHHSMVYNEIAKIKNQKALHQLQDFKQEYHALLKANVMTHQLDA